jgi:two-component system CAI-1 autoinducer sensor kinase/phosphatase CqsS
MNPLNKQTLDMILELADGDNNVLLELFSSFLKDAKELSQEINSAVYNLDWEKLQFKVHTLKGLSGTIGARSLFEICKTLNNDLKNGDKLTAIRLANSIVIECKELADYLRTNYKI